MRHIIVFCYIFTILIGVSGFTIQWLAGRKKKCQNREERSLNYFIIVLLLMNGYDFFVYYNENISQAIKGNLLISVGDCIIALLVMLWIKVEVGLSESPSGKITKYSTWYVEIYIFVWVIAVIFFKNIEWIRIAIDIPLILLLIIGSVILIVDGIKNKQKKSLLWYKGIVTVFMTFNYVTYFASEARWMPGGINGTESPLNITIFYWLVINVANLLLLYKQDFTKSYFEESPKNMAFDVDQAIEGMGEKYTLTSREKDIAKEIYNGKTNGQIASTLYISESTVKAHIYNIFRKLGVKNRVGVVCLIRGEEPPERITGEND